LNAQIEDVIGGWDEHPTAQGQTRIRSGILKQADQNILFIDEVNLLKDEIINAILDAAAQGRYTVRRGPISSTYRARFTLIGSMNPEEGFLRPQITDRFGLRIIVRGLEKMDERLEAYRRSRAYRLNPRNTVGQYADNTEMARDEIQAARELLPSVQIPPEVEQAGAGLIQHLGIDSLRAEMTMFEAARAYAAADARKQVSLDDLKMVAPMALRLRQSAFMIKYFKDQSEEENRLNQTLQKVMDLSGSSIKEENHGEANQRSTP
jgi:magnesium chelatase subunit I